MAGQTNAGATRSASDRLSKQSQSWGALSQVRLSLAAQLAPVRSPAPTADNNHPRRGLVRKQRVGDTRKMARRWHVQTPPFSPSEDE